MALTVSAAGSVSRVRSRLDAPIASLWERNRAVRILLQIGEDVGALMRIRLAGIGHLGAGDIGRRLGQKRVESRVAPVAAFALHAVRITETCDRALRTAHDPK